MGALLSDLGEDRPPTIWERREARTDVVDLERGGRRDQAERLLHAADSSGDFVPHLQCEEANPQAIRGTGVDLDLSSLPVASPAPWEVEGLRDRRPVKWSPHRCRQRRLLSPALLLLRVR